MTQTRTALVTGASSGIGATLARLLASQGTQVALCARRADALEEVRASIESDGGAAHVYPLDVTDPTAVHDVLRKADDDLEGIDLVVANAGIHKGRWSGKLKWADVEPTLRVNVMGSTATLLTLLPRMLERKRGHLVGVSSLAAYRGLPKQAAYCASKAYLSTFLESLRLDLRKTEVAVTDIRPGYVKTPLNAGNEALPFTIDVETAAREIVSAIRRKKAVHAFPITTATFTRSMSTLPAGMYDLLASKVF
jgi:short-subunit dehydrogenase